MVRRSLEHLNARSARVEELKALVQSGAYQIDSAALAQKIVESPMMPKILGVGYSCAYE